MLKKIIIENFKGVESKTIELFNKTMISGTNEVGKSTLVDAFLWCLSGKDTRGRQNSDIRHRNKPELDPSVTLEFTGIKFRRTFKQTASGGNTTVYEIDRGLGFDFVNLNDSKVKGEWVKGYDNYVDELFPNFRLCADIFYLAEGMDTAEARKFVLEHGGKPETEEILSELETDEREIIEELLKTYGINEAQRFLKNKEKELKEKKIKYKGKVEGIRENIEEIRPKAEKEDLEKSKETTERRIAALENRLKMVEVSSDIYEEIEKAKESKRKAEREVTERNDTLLKMHKEKVDKIQSEYQKACQEMDTQHFELLRAYENKEKELKSKISKKDRKEKLESLRSEYLKQIQEEKEKQFNFIPFQVSFFEERKFIQDEKCHACGQLLPADSLKAYRQKFDEEEQKRKSDHYESENTRREAHEESQKQTKEMFEKARERAISDINEKIDNVDRELSVILTMDFEALEKELEELEKPVKPTIFREPTPREPEKEKFDSTDFDLKIMETQKKLETAKSEIAERQKPVYDEIETEKSLLKGIDEHLAKFESVQVLEKSFEKALEEERAIVREMEEVKIKLNAITAYNRALANIVKLRTKEIFGAEIELYREQINGELKDDFIILCETNQGLMPFGIANTASRIKTGMKIVEKMQILFNSRPPVFVDSFESVDLFDDIDCQVIFLQMVKGMKKMEIREIQKN